jgi:hypothetical protein
MPRADNLQQHALPASIKERYNISYVYSLDIPADLLVRYGLDIPTDLLVRYGLDIPADLLI